MPLGSWYSQLPAFGWFDKEDRPGSNALGVPDSQQGIATPTRAGLGKWFLLTPPGGSQPMPFQKTDVGPAPWTGRGVDVSAAAAHQMGYTPGNFPTDANFDVKPIDTTGLGLAAGYMGGVPGENNTAVAEGPPKGQKMPTSLMDMFQPTNAGGQSSSLGDALASRSNSLIGLGLGLMSPAWQGQSVIGNALQGYQGGAAQDATQARFAQQMAHQKTQDARQAALDQFNQAMALRTANRADLTDFQKAAKDLNLTPGTPEHTQFAKEYYAPKTEQPTIVWQDDSSGNKVPYRQDPRSGAVTAIPVPGVTGVAGNPYGASGKMSTDEGKAALFADRAANAHAAITKAENINAEPGGTVGALVQQNLPPGVANMLVSGERGKAMDAQRAFLNALLRRESGAAISSGEYTSYGKEYFPQAGDTSAQIEEKRKHRADVIAGMARESGKGYRPTYSFDQAGNITLGAPSYAGKGTPTAPGGGAALDEARQAIKNGASRDAVIKRLRENNIDPSGL